MSESPKKLAILAISFTAVILIALVAMVLSVPARGPSAPPEDSTRLTAAPAGMGGSGAAPAGEETPPVKPKKQASQNAQAKPRHAKTFKVNGAQVDPKTAQALEAAFHTSLAGSNLWYDRATGLWGAWGGPALGTIMPGLRGFAPLPFEASGGKTHVVINGRALHPKEVQQVIATYGQAIPGRYWMDAAGNVGIENGPFLFNINAGGTGRRGPGSISGAGGTLYNDGKGCMYFEGWASPGC